MRILAGAAAVIVLVGVGVGGGLGVQRLLDGDSANTHVDIYVDRTPAPQEVEIRHAAQKLLDDYNTRQWQDVFTDWASFCRNAASADEYEANWGAHPDQTWHFELRKFSVTEIHDKTAIVDSQVVLIDKAGTGVYGPDSGSKPFISSFTYEDGQWRACE